MRSMIYTSVLLLAGAAAFGAAAVPRPAPQLKILDYKGEHVLSSYKGKVVVVQFLLTTCSHCQDCSQMLNRFQAQYGPRGFQVLGAAVNEATPEMANEYAAKYAPGFPVGPLLRDPMLSFMSISIMERPGFPQVAVIDRKGMIREQTTPDMNPQMLTLESHIRALIEKLLSEK
jgi:thiol-disulfide isomerase/thioredoxin